MYARFHRSAMLGLPAFAIASVTMAQPPAQDSRPVVIYGETTAIDTERVPYGDLNLRASADRKALYGRVGRAVRNVCHFDAMGISSDYRVCSTGAWTGARPQIDAAVLKSQLAMNGQAGGATFITVRR